jgi:hypothetical protein
VAAALAAGAAFLAPATGLADDPCTDPYGNSVPFCQQVSVTVPLKTWETKGWPLYCPSNVNYYWGGYSDVWKHSPHIFNENFGGNQSKADFTMSNTHLGSNSVTISIGCSPVSTSESCSGVQRMWSDTGYGQNNVCNVCAGGEDDQTCWLEWDEQCVHGGNTSYWSCTQALFGTLCTSCG